MEQIQINNAQQGMNKDFDKIIDLSFVLNFLQ